MAAGWRGPWRSRVSSSKERQDAVQVYPAYRHPNQSHSYNYNCSRSGTASLSTTAYTTSSSSARVSAHSLLSPLGAAPPQPVVEIDEAGEVGQGGVTDQEKAKTREHIRDLLMIHDESHGGMDKWLSELRVSWVLHLAELEPASARRTFISRRLQHTAHSWAMALRLITRSIVCFTGWCISQDQEEDEADDIWWPPASEFVGFVAATFLQILPFVDVLVALDTTNPSSSEHSDDTGSAVPSVVHKFQTLADVREALSGASEQVLLWHLWLDDTEATRISARMSSLLLAKLDRLDEAIRDTRDYIKAQSMSLMTPEDDDSLKISSELLDQSPDIHKVTRSVISYVIVLSASQDRPDAVVDPPVVVHEAMDSLEKKLTRLSHSFQDQSLRFLFLINNLYFVWHQLRTNRLLDAPMQALARKIDGYINSYLQVSWVPVLEPLHNNAFCCFTGYSAKRKFESKFDKTYAAQKLWKVPDPELREELRTAIANTVISAFTSFLEDTGIRALSKLTPESLEEMLEDLFEGFFSGKHTGCDNGHSYKR